MALVLNLLTTREVADRIGRDRQTVLSAVREGRLKPAYQAPKTGGYFFELKEVERVYGK